MLQCNVCELSFEKVDFFKHHTKRHFTIDHFRCPYCFKGFTKLSMCQDHELKEHEKEYNADTAKLPLLSSTLKKDLEECVVPSTTLYPYKGPPVKLQQDTYRVEAKYGRQKKSYSAKISKYANHFREWRKPEWESPTKKSTESDTDYEDEVEILEPPAPKPVLLYMCSLCGFGCSSEEELSIHGARRHPGSELSQILQVYKIGSSASASASASSKQPEKQEESLPVPSIPQISESSARIFQEELGKLSKIQLSKKLEFTLRLGLVPTRKYLSRVGYPPPTFKELQVSLNNCSNLEGKSHFFRCNLCGLKDYYTVSREQMEAHRIESHPDESYRDIVKFFVRGNVGDAPWGLNPKKPLFPFRRNPSRRTLASKNSTKPKVTYKDESDDHESDSSGGKRVRKKKRKLKAKGKAANGGNKNKKRKKNEVQEVVTIHSSESDDF